MPRPRISRIVSSRLSSSWPVATVLRRSPTQTEGCSAIRCNLRRVIGERGSTQVLHGEPHPGNVLSTRNGLVFIDLETCCRGPLEFDLAHAPEEVGEHYRGVDPDFLRECRILVLAMITTWRWDAGDQLPNGRQLATDWPRPDSNSTRSQLAENPRLIANVKRISFDGATGCSPARSSTRPVNDP
jgi:Phosphotransferase enzyme family